MKRIVSIQDLSCIGKCSLGVALPVLSAMGLECAALPTALLSAHTAFDGFVCRDMQEFFRPVAAHWRSLGLRFDAVSTGYLGDPALVELVQEFISDFASPQTPVIVDPAMADHGRLYAGLSPDLPEKMKSLCRHADILTPNITEACLLTGLAYRETNDEVFVRTALEKLLQLGARTAIVTGVHMRADRIGVAAMDDSGEMSLYETAYLPGVFYGTGDLFASVCAGALTLGLSAKDAAALAAEYIYDTLRVTAADPDRRWYGVSFEATLPALIERLGRALGKEEPQ